MADRERDLVDVECADCGDPARITHGAVKKRERRNMGPYKCRFCISQQIQREGRAGRPRRKFDHDEARRLYASGVTPNKLAGHFGVSVWTIYDVVLIDRAKKKKAKGEWRRPEEMLGDDMRHGARHWAWKLLKTMTPEERHEIAAALNGIALEGDDRSSFARHRRQRREPTMFDPHPYAKLEQPFGAKARGEMAA